MQTKKKAPKTINTTTQKKKVVRKTRAKKPTANQSPEVEKALAAIKEEAARLKEENTRLAERYGKMLEQSTNIRLKANAMLGQILKALYIMGIGPEEIQAKSQQMFRKKVDAD